MLYSRIPFNRPLIAYAVLSFLKLSGASECIMGCLLKKMITVLRFSLKGGSGAKIIPNKGV